MKLRVAALQLGPYKGDYEEQLTAIEKQVERAATSYPVDVIVLPELMTTPYFPRSQDLKWREEAEPFLTGPTLPRIRRLAQRVSSSIIATCYEKSGAERYNTAFIVDAGGNLVGKYRKTHIPLIESVLAYETLFFDQGQDLPVFTVAGVRVGILICYDRSFPEAWRTLALKGAQVVFVPTSSSGYRGNLYADELKLAAAHHQIFVVGSNKAGEEFLLGEAGSITFYGKSRIIDPLGNVLAALEGEQEAFVAAELDLDQVAAARQKLGYYRDRRTDLYCLQ